MCTYSCLHAFIYDCWYRYACWSFVNSVCTSLSCKLTASAVIMPAGPPPTTTAVFLTSSPPSVSSPGFVVRSEVNQDGRKDPRRNKTLSKFYMQWTIKTDISWMRTAVCEVCRDSRDMDMASWANFDLEIFAILPGGLACFLLDSIRLYVLVVKLVGTCKPWIIQQASSSPTKIPLHFLCAFFWRQFSSLNLSLKKKISSQLMCFGPGIAVHGTCLVTYIRMSWS